MNTREHALRAQCREWAADFRRAALAADRSGGDLSALVDLPAFRYLGTMGVPRDYGHEPILVAGQRCYGTSAAERAVVLEELACGDAGLLLAAPGALQAGPLVEALGSSRQKKWFYTQLLDDPMWTFVARQGESAPAAARAGLGVVLVDGTAVLTDTAAVRTTPTAATGLRAAQWAAVELEPDAIDRDRVLGPHPAPMVRAATERLRAGLASIGIGIARAALEYVGRERRRLRWADRDRLDSLERRTTSTRELVRTTACGDARVSGSTAFTHSARIATEATSRACDFFGRHAREQHPLLDKFFRDAREMEHWLG